MCTHTQKHIYTNRNLLMTSGPLCDRMQFKQLYQIVFVPSGVSEETRAQTRTGLVLTEACAEDH